jgi:hypothetical protein
VQPAGKSVCFMIRMVVGTGGHAGSDIARRPSSLAQEWVGLVRSLVELRVFHGDTCERLNEEIGNMWEVLSQVGNQG